jgi:hypothetical protein
MKYFSNLRDKTFAWTVPGSVRDREKKNSFHPAERI